MGRQIAVFLGLTFVWAWGFWGFWVVAMPPGGLVMSPAFLVTAIIGGLAPSVAAILTLGLMDGVDTAKHLGGRLGKWPSARIAAVSLLLAPALAAIAWTITGSVFRSLAWPDVPALLPLLLVWPLLAALGEELGWRGFLQPRLASRLGVVGAALVVGVVWGLWHLPADYVALKGLGDGFWLAFFVNGPLVLTAHALVMAWLWQLSGGNLVSMILYHLGITASAMLTPSPGTEAFAQITAAAIGAGVVWVAALLLWLLLGERKGKLSP